MAGSRDAKAGQRCDADRGVGACDSDLVRYFSLVCIGVLVVVTFVMCTGFYFASKRYISAGERPSATGLVTSRLRPKELLR
jgi:hypothetical protein